MYSGESSSCFSMYLEESVDSSVVRVRREGDDRLQENTI